MHISAQDFRDVQTLVRTLCGLILSNDKMYLVRTRLESVVQAHGFATFSEYMSRLQEINAGVMRDELVEALTTGETSFNRDTHPFVEFRSRVLPSLAEIIRRRREARYPLPFARIWSAGCSTGQEPYSLAMAIQDFVSANPKLGLRLEHFPILATDVSGKSLNIAKAGLYLAREIDRGIDASARSRHLHQAGTAWIFNDDLRRAIDFRRLNFIDPVTNLGPFDVIFCRNVMIYFDAPTRQKLCDHFHQLLAPGGLLILGAAESLYGLNTLFMSEQIGSTVAYRKAGYAPVLE